MTRPADIEDLYVLTPMQQGILFHSLRSQRAGVYFEQLVWSLEQPVDPRAFRGAWQRVIDRHTILRTAFLWEGVNEPLQVVHRRAEVELAELDWRQLGPEVERRLAALLAADRRRGFALEVPPLMRLTLIRTAAQSYRFIWSHHHLLLDGWSYPLLLAEVIACYGALLAGREPALGRRRPFRDYVAHLATRDLAATERYWRRALAGLSGPTPLGVDRLVPEALADEELYAAVELQLPADVTAALQRLAALHQVPPNTLVQAAWALLLSRYGGATDVVFGIIVSSRPPALTGSEAMVGLFLNNVPMRVGVAPGSALGAWLRRVHAQQFEIFQHEHCGLQKILEWSGLPRGQALFESYLTFQNYPSAEFYREHGGALILRDLDFSIRTGFALTLVAGFVPLFGVGVTYDRRRFDEATCRRMLGHLEAILTGWAARPESRLEEVSLLRPAERHQLLTEWNDTRAELPPPPLLHAWIEAQAARTPDRVGVEMEGETLTWRELDRRSNQLAALLRRHGAGRGSVVGIYLERGTALMVALLAVLKAGGAYLPLDLDHPRDRVAYMLLDAGARVAITLERHAGGLPESVFRLRLDADAAAIARQSPQREPAGAGGDDLAYVIYTSGSSGRPKGAMNTHRAVVNRLLWMQQTYRLTGEDRVLQKTPTSFDVSVWELFWPLMTGARLVFARPEGHRDSAYLVQLVRRRRVTVMHFVPSLLQPFLDEPAVGGCASLRQVIASGETLSRELQERFFARLPGVALDNLYGPTEAAIDVSSWACRKGSRQSSVPIGRPIVNLRLHVLGPGCAPAPAGVPAELYIGGDGLARGYLARPDLTAERFLPDPFADHPGERLYRTGDRVRRLPDGNLEFLERIDHQVKVRGLRIELGEIESALRAEGALTEAVVVAREDATGDRVLVAYGVPAGDGPPTVNRLRRLLGRTLPAAMIPSAFVFLPALPRTTSGKVDRRALPAPAAVRPAVEEAYEAPRTAAERALAAIWSEVLGIERIGVRDNFFTLGGDSMKSLRVVSKARQQRLDLDLDRLVSQPTIEALAGTGFAAGPASAVPPGGAGGPGAAFSLLAAADRPRLPADVEDAYPLTRLQTGMLFFGEYSPGASTYHDVFSYRFEAPCASAAAERALRAVMRRHPVLRTSFDLRGPGEPLQLVHRDVAAPLAVADLRGRSAADARRRIDAWIDEERTRAFDWQRPPLFRAQVHRLSGPAFRFTLSFHHAILDGWSVAALVGELARAYSALVRGEPLPDERPPQATFRDFVALERAAIGSAATRAFWGTRLADLPDPRLPLAAVAQGDGGGRARERRRPAVELSRFLAGLKEAARQAAVPLKSVLLATHLRMLALLTAGDEVVAGLVLNNRPEIEDGERVLGMLLSALPLRLRLGDGSWLELIRRTFEAEREMLAHRRYPLAEMVRLTGTPTLFEAVFNFTHFYGSGGEDETGGIRITGERFFEETNFPLVATFSLDPEGTRLLLSLEVDPARLTAARALEVEGCFVRTLETLAAAPAASHRRRSLLAPAALHALLVEWNDTAAELPEGATLPGLFERQARETPAAVALEMEGDRMSYGELAARANRLARYLGRLGVGPEVLVGLAMERSFDLVVGLLGILKAGGAYVPLDPDYPRERLASMIDGSALALLLSHEALIPRLPAGSARTLAIDRAWPEIARQEPTAPAVGLHPENLAYVIHTSGSTGQPKGVQIPHSAVVNFLRAMSREPGLDAADTLLAVTTLSFDIAGLELYLPLTRGARVVLAAREVARSGDQLAECIALTRTTVMQATPATWRLLLASGWEGEATLRILCGGEALPRDLADELLARARELWNLYGPTETTIWSLAARVESGERITLGRPLDNTRVHLLDRHGDLVAAGLPGELHIGGAGLSRGYLRQSGLTAERFIPDPFSPSPGGRLYATGDLARRLPDGALEFLGRTDHQVKVRGFRIELGEIEEALARHPLIRQAVAAVREDASGAQRLAAYFVAVDDAEPTASELRAFLHERLPDPMVPAFFVPLAALPLTPNGKVDRRSLPDLDPGRLAPAPGFVPARTPVEETLAAIWRGVLRVERVGAEDNFFDLGGDSILSVQIVARAREANLRVTPQQIFELQTLAKLAAAAEAVGAAATERAEPPDLALSEERLGRVLAELDFSSLEDRDR